MHKEPLVFISYTKYDVTYLYTIHYFIILSYFFSLSLLTYYLCNEFLQSFVLQVAPAAAISLNVTTFNSFRSEGHYSDLHAIMPSSKGTSHN